MYTEIREQKVISDELSEKLEAELEKIAGRFAPAQTAA